MPDAMLVIVMMTMMAMVLVILGHDGDAHGAGNRISIAPV